MGLREALDSLELSDVKTYIQSGNVVFKSKPLATTELAQNIGAAISERFEFRPRVLILELNNLRKAISRNPFPEGEVDPKTLHFYFLQTIPEELGLGTLESLKAPTERFDLIGKVFYLHAPDGVGRSKLAAKAEKALGVSATARNWRTVGKLMALAEEV